MTSDELRGLTVRVVSRAPLPPWQQAAVDRVRAAGARIIRTDGERDVPDDVSVSGVVLVLDGNEIDQVPTPPARSWRFRFTTDPELGSTTVSLLELGADRPRVLRRASLPARPHDPRGAQDRLLREASLLPWRAALDRVRGASPCEAGDPTDISPDEASTPPPVPATRAAPRTHLRAQLERVTRANHWSIGAAPLPSAADPVDLGADLFTWAELPDDGGFLADPFIVPGSSPLVVLAEQLTAADLTGRIVRLQLDAGGWSAPEPVLPLPAHASYPFLFTATLDGEESLCMVPETSALRQVRLYRGSPDARDWQLHAVLLDDHAVADPTVFRHDRRWWLLGTDADAGVNTHLCAYWAEDLNGPWTPHAANPVKVDIASARPAGTPWMTASGLVRPGQDSGSRYGGRVVLHRITRLDPSHFAEVPVGVVAPDPRGGFPAGLHTVSRDGDRLVIDGCRRAPAFRRLGPALRRRLGRTPEEVR